MGAAANQVAAMMTGSSAQPDQVQSAGFAQYRRTKPKLINTHKWIVLATWGPPPRGQGLVCTHVCGNSFCVAAKHLRYQTETANHYDSEHHETYNHDQHRVSRLSWGVNEAYKL